MKFRHVIGLLVSTAFFAVPAAAFAGTDPSTGANTGDGIQGAVSSSGSGSLPFTGLNLAIVLAGGLLLVAVGILMRRRGAEN